MQAHAELETQNVHDVLDNVGPVSELGEKRERRRFDPLEPAHGAAVTLPRLRLYDDVVGPLTQTGQEVLQADVTVIQMDPHGRREAENKLPNRNVSISKHSRFRLNQFNTVHYIKIRLFKLIRNSPHLR